MRKSEINDMIFKRVMELKETEPLKTFLMKVIENEITIVDRRIEDSKLKKVVYSQDYYTWAIDYSNKER